jgi:aldehyde dehydrogenase (NAD+)
MLKFADLLEEYYDKLGDLTRLTLGSTPAFAQMEASVAAQGLRYNAGWIDKFAGQTYPEADGFLKIIRNEPLGVTAGIVPWNGPLVTIGLKAAPALATGNCFIFKPSEKTPFAALALGPLIKEAGFPPGVFQVLPGDGSTGALLSSHMDIRKISFTGSCATGKKILEMAAKSNLKRVTLELGGKSPAVIFDDCNIPNAVKWTVDAITAGSGQTCFAASRVYVQEGIYDEFMTAYVQAMKDKAKVMGDPEAPGTELAPMVDRAQYERVSGFIQRGRSQGKLLVGGPRAGDKVFNITISVSISIPKFLLSLSLLQTRPDRHKLTMNESTTNRASSSNPPSSLKQTPNPRSTRKRSLAPSPSSGASRPKKRS